MTTDIGQKDHAKALSSLFASSARAVVLRFFLLDPSREYYQRQIEAATGLPIRAVQRELERLTATGLLFRRTEGNRAYYQVDTQFPLFPELRSMVIKTGLDDERLRAAAASDDATALAFLHEDAKRVLVVSAGGGRPALSVPGSYTLEVMTMPAFLEALAERAPGLDGYLTRGVDLLGRREDIVWRRIEAAGYAVRKGRGVA